MTMRKKRSPAEALSRRENGKDGRIKDQGARSKEQGARSKEQGARSKEQGARSKEQGARSKEQEFRKCVRRRSRYEAWRRVPELPGRASFSAMFRTWPPPRRISAPEALPLCPMAFP